MSGVDLVSELEPLPAILADREQIQSVVTNLVLNARDALGLGRTNPMCAPSIVAIAWFSRWSTTAAA